LLIEFSKASHVIRDEQIEFLFSKTIGVFEGAFLGRLQLSEEETVAFEERVFAWFDRFTRRPGNEHVPVGRFQIPLLSGACNLARDLGESKGVTVAFLPADPKDAARQLGLLEGPETGAPEL
jgi:hypothetical protein